MPKTILQQTYSVLTADVLTATLEELRLGLKELSFTAPAIAVNEAAVTAQIEALEGEGVTAIEVLDFSAEVVELNTVVQIIFEVDADFVPLLATFGGLDLNNSQTTIPAQISDLGSGSTPEGYANILAASQSYPWFNLFPGLSNSPEEE